MNKKIFSIVVSSILILSVLLYCIIGEVRASNRDKLIKALWVNDLVKAEELLKKGVNPNKGNTLFEIPFMDIFVEYPMLIIARSNRLDGLKLMVKYGGDVNLRKDDTPLTAACYAHPTENLTIEVIKFLLENGADINMTRKWDGHTPIQVAFEGSNNKELRQEIIFYLIEQGAKIDVKTPDKQETLLHLAARCGFDEIVKYLLENGIDKTLKDKSGNTALDYAIEFERTEVIAILS